MPRQRNYHRAPQVAMQAVLLLQPGDDRPELIMVESIGLSDLQHWVGGYVECPKVRGLTDHNVLVWCDEDGKLKGLPTTLVIDQPFHVITIVGPVLFTGGNMSAPGGWRGLDEQEQALVRSFCEEWRPK